MASDPVPKFDHSRVLDIGRYRELNTPKDCMAFTWMVKEYMEYARSNPSKRSDWQEGAEKVLVVGFLKAIRSPEGWPHARQAVPEFKEPPGEINHLFEPLRTIMEGVRPMLRPAVVEVPDTQRVEEELNWQHLRRQIEYVGYLAGEASITSSERKAEVNESVRILADTLNMIDGEEIRRL